VRKAVQMVGLMVAQKVANWAAHLVASRADSTAVSSVASTERRKAANLVAESVELTAVSWADSKVVNLAALTAVPKVVY